MRKKVFSKFIKTDFEDVLFIFCCFNTRWHLKIKRVVFLETVNKSKPGKLCFKLVVFWQTLMIGHWIGATTASVRLLHSIKVKLT